MRERLGDECTETCYVPGQEDGNNVLHCLVISYGPQKEVKIQSIRKYESTTEINEKGEEVTLPPKPPRVNGSFTFDAVAFQEKSRNDGVVCAITGQQRSLIAGLSANDFKPTTAVNEVANAPPMAASP